MEEDPKISEAPGAGLRCRRLRLPGPAIAALRQTFRQLVQTLLNLDLDDGKLKTLG